MHCSRRRLLQQGLEFHVCTINKSAHTKKKPGNLFNDPRINEFHNFSFQMKFNYLKQCGYIFAEWQLDLLRWMKPSYGPSLQIFNGFRFRLFAGYLVNMWDFFFFFFLLRKFSSLLCQEIHYCPKKWYHLTNFLSRVRKLSWVSRYIGALNVEIMIAIISGLSNDLQPLSWMT